MSKEMVHTNQAPEAIGPYSQAIRCGDLVFTSGQLGMDRDGVLPESVAEQASMALKNLSAVLQAAGSSMEKVLKCTVFLTDMGDFFAVNEAYAQFFNAPCPARSCVAVAALPKGGKVEIEAVAEV